MADIPDLGAYASLSGDGPAKPVAFFVSAHGFGHAARACAVMAAARALDQALHFHVFTEVPEWFFGQSLDAGYTYHRAATDVGLVQPSALVEDLPATADRLDVFLPFDDALLQTWAAWLERLGCTAVACDISPLGLAVAGAAGLRDLLLENFTWDWIYGGLAAAEPRLKRHADYLRRVYAAASVHVQAEPVGQPRPGARPVPPISRAPRQPAAVTRARLGLLAHERLVLVSMGGVPQPLELPASAEDSIVYVVPGTTGAAGRHGPVLALPAQSGLFHPDLVSAADAVMGKAGYSTVAEAYAAGVPYGYVTRPRFRESPVLAAFIHREMTGLEVPIADLAAGRWAPWAEKLLEMPRKSGERANGAAEAAQAVVDLVD